MASRSPWLQQLHRTRAVKVLEKDLRVDVVIIGGGIAGITSALEVLRNTNKSVVLLEAGRVAHGATGHNAGQLVSYFERPFSSLVQSFGLKKAAEGLVEVKNAWSIIDRIYREIKLNTYYASFTGYAGFVNEQQIKTVLEDLRLQREAGIKIEYLLIDSSVNLEPQYDGLYEKVDSQRIKQLLSTKDHSYKAVLCTRKGVLNSASFCEEMVEHLVLEYSERFLIYEHSVVERIEFSHHEAQVHTMHNTIKTQQVVLCTNGYHSCEIIGLDGNKLNSSLLVKGTVGLMEGFLCAEESNPSAISFVRSSDHHTPYMYVTRRPYHEHTLICVGGPEKELPPNETYSSHVEYLTEAAQLINDFLARTYDEENRFVKAFAWQGLMGYTPNGIRLVGKDAKEPRLLYNLGCNGVGILPSFAASLRVARLIKGETLQPSIFDP